MGITRTEMLARLGLLDPVEPTTAAAFAHHEERAWREDWDNDPHGHPWHTSFHASSFPGTDRRACGRRAIYTLMNAAPKEPTPRRLRQQAEVGQAIETLLVRRWGTFKVLLSNDRTRGEEVQTGFVDEERWFTGNCDAIIVPLGWNRPHVVEVKTKAHDQVVEMRRLQRGPDEAHVRQLKSYIGFAHEESRERWPDLEPCVDGSIFYVSREDNETTRAFFYSYDARFMAVGRARLAEWRDHFLRGTLPPHPFGGKEWSKPPCQYCKYKKHVCKPDHQAGVERLRDSSTLAWTAEVRGEYDYDEARRAVLERWKAEDAEER